MSLAKTQKQQIRKENTETVNNEEKDRKIEKLGQIIIIFPSLKMIG